MLMAGIAIWLDQPDAEKSETAAVVRTTNATAGAIYAARFADTDGVIHELGKWQNQLLVINFWATWCAPCKEEMPMFAKMQEKYRQDRLQIVGIAVDSSVNVAKFKMTLPVGYPLFPAESRAMEFSKRLGNRLGLLPHTVIIRQGGEVIFSRMGVVQQSEFEEIVAKMMVK
jgi:thiol-disulfide isomerase/thioredoxin